MEKVLLIFAAASALSADSSLPIRTFYFIEELKNWTEAQSFCREKYTDLVTIEDMKNVTTINSLLPADLVQAWIGFYDDVNSWRWSISDSNIYPPGEKPFRNWFVGSPDNSDGKDACGAMADDGYWRDVQCISNLQYVCFEATNATLIIIYTPTTFTQAQTYCRQHYTDLVSVMNQADNLKVKNLVPAGMWIWIGLFRDTWKWSDGSNSSFSFWHTGEPNNSGGNEECGVTVLPEAGEWEDQNCASMFSSVCYDIPHYKHVVKLKLVKTSSLVLDDPAVLQNLLTQLKQKLKDQGVNISIKLSWKKQEDGNIFHLEPSEEKHLP